MQFILRLVPVALALFLTAATAPTAGRLPRTVVPVSYDILIAPDAQAMTFAGSETVEVDVREATRTITLNAAGLAIGGATFDGEPARVRLDVATQTATITFGALATPGRHRLQLAWTGKINTSAAGLFAIDYADADGTRRRMLATQFEAPDARRFAPMWDEPDFKARFTLSVAVPAGQLAFSNMPVASTVGAPDGKRLHRFAQTPVMSSYLLFLGMGDLERRTVMAGRTEIGVITRRGVSRQGDYALAQAKRLLAYYNSYFGQPYPLPKLDMIAGPGSSQFFGAMENWGAIFYFENELLVDPARTTESGRQRIFTVVSHEIAHQWFGDLVTMAWWDDLWLNEGFASWMEAKSSADLNPSWQADTQAVAGAREQALTLDATAATHPIIQRIATVDQIDGAFDNITYAKGQAVIAMLEATLGPDAFRAGIRRYMARYKYGNTVTDQLWAELAAATGRPVAQIANDFTLQGGVPLVTIGDVRCVRGGTVATATQGRFGVDAASQAPQTWRVPMLLTAGGRAQAVTVSGAAPTPVRAPGCGTFVANAGKGSYVRARYDDAAHAAIVRGFRGLRLNDRVGQLGDDFALASGGYQDLSRWFAVQAQIGTDANGLEWSVLAAWLDYLGSLYDGTPLATPLRERIVGRLSPELQRLGYATRPGESPVDTILREELILVLGTSGDTAVATRARGYVAAMRTDPIPAAIRAPVLATYAANATAAEWDALLAMATAETSPVGRNRLLALLGSARDPAVARRGFALLAGDRLTAPQKASLLRAIANAHPDLAFDWAVAHRAQVDGFIEANSRGRFIPSLGAGSNDSAMPGKIVAYAEASLPESARDGTRRTVAQMAARKATADRLRAATQRWVGEGR